MFGRVLYKLTDIILSSKKMFSPSHKKMMVLEVKIKSIVVSEIQLLNDICDFFDNEGIQEITFVILFCPHT